MADNLTIKDSAGTVRTLRTTDTGTAHIPHHIIEGAANVAAAQVATSTTAATLVIARPTRKQVTIKNVDASIVVYVGPATVTTASGFKLGPGETLTLSWVGLIQVIAASGTPAVHVVDEYY